MCHLLTSEKKRNTDQQKGYFPLSTRKNDEVEQWRD